MKPIRVLLVDDHPVTRMGIRNLLKKAPDMEIVGEAGDGLEALRKVEELLPDVIVLDMEMPQMSGLRVAQQLKMEAKSVRVLALSAYDDTFYVRELLENGASGYLVKEEAPDSIVDAVRGVARGEKGWVSRTVAARIAVQLQEPKNNRMTSREISILRRMASGKTNQEIGVDLGISEKTVEKHMNSIYQKLGVSSRVDAAVLAARKGWV